MKEIIVFKTESSIKGRKEIAKINEYVNNFNFDCAFERKVEQVPETLGQVAFLLRQKLQENNRDWYIETHIDRHKQEFRFMGILFSSDKTLSIKINGADVVVMTNISYPLMWQIIKALTGEE